MVRTWNSRQSSGFSAYMLRRRRRGSEFGEPSAAYKSTYTNMSTHTK